VAQALVLTAGLELVMQLPQTMQGAVFTTPQAQLPQTGQQAWRWMLTVQT
jgi:hypothetical protein